MTMPIWRSDLHVEVFGNGIRLNFSDQSRGKMEQAPFAGEIIRENKLTWLLAPITDRDPNFVADEIIRWAEGEDLETSR
ncbi:MAG: hypothetical protein ACNS61_15205 [Candidatus Wenzhouxiangella sp. M2_3B_020]